jgi:hypothetical protein
MRDTIARRTAFSIADRSATNPLAAYALLEVLLAAGMLAFLVISLYGAFSFGFNVIRLSQEDVRASQILVERLETLRIYNWSKISSSYFPSTFTAYYSPSGGPNQQGVAYNGSISISPAPITESYSNTLRQITVALSWDSFGGTHSRSMSTLVSSNGIQTYKP